MVRISAKIISKGIGIKKIFKRINSLNSKDIAAGVFGGGKQVEIAAIHEFGGNIQHPGGTEYGFQTKEAASKNKNKNQIRFLKKGQGYVVLGKTKPHIIHIPQRSYLRSTLRENRKKIRGLFFKALKKVVIDGRMTSDQAFHIIGQIFSDMVQRKIRKGQFKPLKPSTIKRKGSTKPLINTGRLLGSITYRIRRRK